MEDQQGGQVVVLPPPAPVAQQPASVEPPVPLWQRIAISITAVGALLGGGSGVAALADAVNEPENTSQVSCKTYWDDMQEMREEGFRGFKLMDDKELEDRCGEADRVARSWEDPPVPVPVPSP